MAKITSRSSLNVGTEITIDETARTFTLIEAGNLVAKDGVTGQALYSKLEDLWTTAGYQDSPFPMYAIDVLSGQFYFGTDGATYSGWKPADDTTRQMLRDMGWREYSAAGVLNREYVCAAGLGVVSSGAQEYYQRSVGGSPIDFTFTDQVNEGVQVYGDASNGNFDNRAYMKTFCREQGYTFSESVLSDTGKNGTGAYIVNFLLSNGEDLKITAEDVAMTGAPYDGITVSYYTANQSIDIGGTGYPFKIVIDGDGATLEQIYTKMNYLLRQATDINEAGDAGTITGKTAALLLEFVGDNIIGAESVVIINMNAADLNRATFTDANGVERQHPYVAAGTIESNSFLVGSGSTYRMMYTTTPDGDDYGESTAVTVNDADGTPITGTISAASISFTFDYDGNTQGGYAGGTDRPYTVIAIRPGYGKFTVATGTLTRSKANKVVLTAENDSRVYA